MGSREKIYDDAMPNFEDIDKDGNGKIDRKEFIEAFLANDGAKPRSQSFIDGSGSLWSPQKPERERLKKIEEMAKGFQSHTPDARGSARSASSRVEAPTHRAKGAQSAPRGYRNVVRSPNAYDPTYRNLNKELEVSGYSAPKNTPQTNQLDTRTGSFSTPQSLQRSGLFRDSLHESPSIESKALIESVKGGPIDELRKKYNQLVVKLNHERGQTEKERKKWQLYESELHSLRRKIKTLGREKNVLLERMDKMSRSNKDMDSNHENLSRNYDLLLEQKRALEKRFGILTQSAASLKRHYDELKKSNKKLTYKIHQLESSLDDRQRRVKSLKEKLGQAEHRANKAHEIVQLSANPDQKKFYEEQRLMQEDHVKELIAKENEHKLQRKTWQQELTKRTQDLREARKKIAFFESSENTLLADLSRKMDKLQKSQLSNAEVVDKIHTVQLNKGDEASQLRDQLSDLKAQLSDASKELQETKKNCGKSEGHAIALMEQLQRVRADRDAERKANEELNKRLIELQSRNDVEHATEELSKTLSSQRKTAEGGSGQLQGHREILESVNKIHSSLQNELAKASKDRIADREVIKELKEELGALKQKPLATSGSMGRLQGSDHLLESMAKIHSSLKEELAKASSSRSSDLKVMEELNTRLAALQMGTKLTMGKGENLDENSELASKITEIHAGLEKKQKGVVEADQVLRAIGQDVSNLKKAVVEIHRTALSQMEFREQLKTQSLSLQESLNKGASERSQRMGKELSDLRAEVHAMPRTLEKSSLKTLSTKLSEKIDGIGNAIEDTKQPVQSHIVDNVKTSFLEALDPLRDSAEKTLKKLDDILTTISKPLPSNEEAKRSHGELVVKGSQHLAKIQDGVRELLQKIQDDSSAQQNMTLLKQEVGSVRTNVEDFKKEMKSMLEKLLSQELQALKKHSQAMRKQMESVEGKTTKQICGHVDKSGENQKKMLQALMKKVDKQPKANLTISALEVKRISKDISETVRLPEVKFDEVQSNELLKTMLKYCAYCDIGLGSFFGLLVVLLFVTIAEPDFVKYT
mmetsp:Transcript_8160/g.20029  ORF Transcript_8160/g.20029 Transcript_8160/m.20029 type:complete len:1044 (-) Transcript_8160:229-3360(-)